MHNSVNFIRSTDFSGLLQKMSIENIRLNPLYEKAYLDRNEMPASEYCLNTTTWD